jgi:membrane-associated PAP2 superfamily phosphatase
MAIIMKVMIFMLHAFSVSMDFSFSCLVHTVKKLTHSFFASHNLENIWCVWLQYFSFVIMCHNPSVKNLAGSGIGLDLNSMDFSFHSC